MNEQELIKYYNKFNEEKRLNTRHGQVEFLTSIKYINYYLKKFKNPHIIDIGAGSGKYSAYLVNKGYNVTAVELIKHNVKKIEALNLNIKVIMANAINLKKISDKSYDLTLLFGPMYHLISKEEKLKALNEAKRITKKGGIIMVAYCMNDYAIITHGFKDNNIKSCIKNHELDKNFHCCPKKNDLYSMVRLEDINELNNLASLKRIKIISPDGPANYMRSTLNKMDEETFQIFLQYHFKTCERADLIGASYHTLDILKNDWCKLHLFLFPIFNKNN